MDERLRLGSELQLTRRFVPVARAGMAPGIPRFRTRLTARSANGLPALPEQYRLERTGEALVELENDALEQLYLVLGGPGSGKSFFFMDILRQLADTRRWNQPWGGLLLDPKGTLAARTMAEIGTDQLVSIGITSARRVNLLACHLPPHDLGVALALAGQSAGVGGSEPYWINQLKLVFGAGLAALAMTEAARTLRNLAELLLASDPTPGKDVSRLSGVLALLRKREMSSDDSRRRSRVLAALDPFATAKGETADTIRTFVQQILSPFLDPALDQLSATEDLPSVADLIFDQGKWIVLDLPKTSLSTSKFVSSLVKILFQQATLARKSQYPSSTRRVFFIVDEYAEVATDLPGEGFGDSIFFSQMREFKVLGMLATQGKSMLANSAIREAWETILTNSSGKLIFKLNDPDSAELAAKQVGERDFLSFDSGSNVSGDSVSSSLGQKVERQTQFAGGVFMGGLQRGEFAYLGSTDARSLPAVRFGRVG